MNRILSILALSASAMLAATPAAYAVQTNYRATMSGPSEAPPNNSPGAGIASVFIDDVADTMRVTIPFFDLFEGTTAAHIHCCTPTPLAGTAGVATQLPTFVDFPLGVTAGDYDRVFDLADPATYNPAFISANGGTAEAAMTSFLNGVAANEAYVNVHSTAFPAGEIRGFLVAAPIPEPATWLMLGVGLAGLGFGYRRRA